MKDTGSIRTATRWPWCSARSAAAALACGLALALGASGCVRRVTNYYLPTEGAPRLGTDELREQSDRMLSVECERLLGGGTSATGEATVVVELDRSGAATRSRITRSSGDSRMDDVFGALTAQLQVDPPTSPRGERTPATLHVGYSCSPEHGVTTVRIP